jgi:betaine lipid synthase
MWTYFTHSQGHLLELKLAAIESLSYQEFFSLFGVGKCIDFRSLLDTRLSPFLSSAAYQFWRQNTDAFSSFYTRGYSGWALKLARLVFACAGVSTHVEDMCNCDTLDDQVAIWRSKIRPVLLNPIVMAFMRNPIFCWNALGVPLPQRKMIVEEGTCSHH